MSGRMAPRHATRGAAHLGNAVNHVSCCDDKSADMVWQCCDGVVSSKVVVREIRSQGRTLFKSLINFLNHMWCIGRQIGQSCDGVFWLTLSDDPNVNPCKPNFGDTCLLTVDSAEPSG